MKTQELMLGDFVTFKDSIESDNPPMKIEIVALGFQDGDENTALVRIADEIACDIIDIDDEVVGIPLTQEILEKNGFVYNDLPFVQGWEQFGLTLCLGGNGYRIDCGINVSLIIDCVHDLQHTLRLCGIEHEITL